MLSDAYIRKIAGTFPVILRTSAQYERGYRSWRGTPLFTNNGWPSNFIVRIERSAAHVLIVFLSSLFYLVFIMSFSICFLSSFLPSCTHLPRCLLLHHLSNFLFLLVLLPVTSLLIISIFIFYIDSNQGNQGVWPAPNTPADLSTTSMQLDAGVPYPQTMVDSDMVSHLMTVCSGTSL